MNHSYFVYIFHPRNELVEHSSCLLLWNALTLHNVVKELSFLHVLHNQKELLRGLYYLVKLYNIRMTNEFEYVYLARHSLNIWYLIDFAFL